MLSLHLIPNTLLFLSFFSFFISRKKTLMSLMSLELILLNMFIMYLMNMSYMNHQISPSMYILVLGACEAALGLSLVINMSRYKGSDMMTKKNTKF